MGERVLHTQGSTRDAARIVQKPGTLHPSSEGCLRTSIRTRIGPLRFPGRRHPEPHHRTGPLVPLHHLRAITEIMPRNSAKDTTYFEESALSGLENPSAVVRRPGGADIKRHLRPDVRGTIAEDAIMRYPRFQGSSYNWKLWISWFAGFETSIGFAWIARQWRREAVRPTRPRLPIDSQHSQF